MVGREGAAGAGSACCSPGREVDHELGGRPSPPAPDHGRRGAADGVADGPDQDPSVEIEGGTFTMGTGRGPTYPADGEGFLHVVSLDDYRIDAVAVSNERFARFVDATGHVTDAERCGWSFVFGGLLPDDFEETRGVAAAPWWRQVNGAAWRSPEGPQSTIEGRERHPVVHLSHRDAVEFCRWSGCRLPTEAEWEYAARGGLTGARFPWGDDLTPGGEHRMNVWQGDFPARNSMEDGHHGTAPVDAFEPNGYGLFNMCGNVWEWCADWFDAGYYQRSPRHRPTGPPTGDRRAMRGGSYLCHASYCHRYRVGARSSNSPESSSGNLGFRTARSP